jgi:nucleotide-binding universal stress UspA family protein
LTISKILVPIDGSPHSEKALKSAIEIAKKFNASLTLLHVIEKPIYVSLPQPAPVTDYHAQELRGQTLDYRAHRPKPDSTVNIARRLGRRILANGIYMVKSEGLDANMKLKQGDPAERIIETAEEDKFDLIVMGSRGLSGIKRFFLGSVIDKVAHHAPCKILIVR